jgi:hypothetical protein
MQRSVPETLAGGSFAAASCKRLYPAAADVEQLRNNKKNDRCMKICQQESPTMHGVRLLEGVVDCLLQAGTNPADILSTLAEVSIRTARRDPQHVSKHLAALAAILTDAAGETKPANDLESDGAPAGRIKP